MIQVGDKVIDKRSGRRYVVMSVEENICEVALIIDGRIVETYKKRFDELVPEKLDESHDLGDVSDNLKDV